MLLPAMASGQTANFNIIPQPQKVEVAQSAAPFVLDQKTCISIAKGNLKNNANMLAQYIEQSTGIRPVVGKATKGGLKNLRFYITDYGRQKSTYNNEL